MYIQDAGCGSNGRVFYCAPKEVINTRTNLNEVRSEVVVIKVANRVGEEENDFECKLALAKDTETTSYSHEYLPDKRDYEEISFIRPLDCYSR